MIKVEKEPESSSLFGLLPLKNQSVKDEETKEFFKTIEEAFENF